jgi:hypothetical protein
VTLGIPHPSIASARATGAALAAAFLLSILSLAFLAFSPSDAWRDARFPNRFIPPPGDFRPVIVWNGNVGSNYTRVFDIRTFLFPMDRSVVLIPMEMHGRGWSGPWYVDRASNVWSEEARFDDFRPVDPEHLRARLAAANTVVHNDERALELVRERLPALVKLPAIRYRPNARSNPFRTLLDEAGRRPFTAMGFRLFALYGSLALLASILRRTWLAGAPAVTGWALAAGGAVAAMTVGMWALAEAMWFDLSPVLFPTLVILAAASLHVPHPDLPAGPEIRPGAAAALFLASVWLVANNVQCLSLDGDIHRYLLQGRILDYFHGWPRAWFASEEIFGSVANYAVGPGLLYAVLFDIVGYTPADLLMPGWQFSAMFRLNQLMFGLFALLAVLPLWDRFRRTGEAGPGLAAVVFLFSPICLGEAFGGENSYWPFLLLLLAAPDSGGRRPAAVAALLLSFVCLQKDEAVVAVLLLVLPSRFLADRWRVTPGLAARSAAFLLALSPFAIYKLRNLAGGFQSKNASFGPFTVDALREALPDLHGILSAEFHAVGAGRLVFWIGAVVLAPLWIAWRGGSITAALRRLAACAAAPLAYLSAFTALYLFSNYVSRPIHAEQSFLRLAYPAVFVFCFAFLVWPSGKGGQLPDRVP